MISDPPGLFDLKDDPPECPPDILDRLTQLFAQANWIRAASMPDNPHQYTLRHEWDRHDFYWAVRMIRQYGRKERYEGHTYLLLDVGEHFYRTMGWPISKTILINRKPLGE